MIKHTKEKTKQMYSSLLLKLGKFFVDNLQDHTKFSIQHRIRTSKEKEIPSKLNTYFTTDWLNQYKKMRDTKWKEENNWKCYKKFMIYSLTQPIQKLVGISTKHNNIRTLLVLHAAKKGTYRWSLLCHMN